jgi:hypothetical protein
MSKQQEKHICVLVDNVLSTAPIALTRVPNERRGQARLPAKIEVLDFGLVHDDMDSWDIASAIRIRMVPLVAS